MPGAQSTNLPVISPYPVITWELPVITRARFNYRVIPQPYTAETVPESMTKLQRLDETTYVKDKMAARMAATKSRSFSLLLEAAEDDAEASIIIKVNESFG
jgi:hypothetical protein